MLRLIVKAIMFILSALFAITWFSESGKQLDASSRIAMVIASIVCVVLCFLVIFLKY